MYRGPEVIKAVANICLCLFICVYSYNLSLFFLINRFQLYFFVKKERSFHLSLQVKHFKISSMIKMSIIHFHTESVPRDHKKTKLWANKPERKRGEKRLYSWPKNKYRISYLHTFLLLMKRKIHIYLKKYMFIVNQPQVLM